jgi:hypothetical protein
MQQLKGLGTVSQTMVAARWNISNEIADYKRSALTNRFVETENMRLQCCRTKRQDNFSNENVEVRRAPEVTKVANCIRICTSI